MVMGVVVVVAILVALAMERKQTVFFLIELQLSVLVYKKNVRRV
ncbi:Uncharacterised protein [Yokenella regensburgei]|uniref:Uncharacterized protein n=1 Tax=Yokenella regensburgei TaxID=158877 RepID=A0AB38FTA4_9ENTR|nr:Uncharacterised protein [Yokenella regensburgei]SQA67071.1 Uncharacterised protein [Yokenella regensburgei]SUQ05515.1 Uncharacterised protein [Yokenella regensburgei]